MFGTGGVGGYIGANLCGKGNEVTIVARGAHLESIRRQGLNIIEDDRTYIARPDSAIDARALEGIYDLVLLCVKSYDMTAAIEALRPHVDPNAIVLPLANGVDHFEMLAASLDAKVLTGCCYILSHIEAPGLIRKKGKVFAAVFGSRAHPDAATSTARLFETAGLRYKTPDNVEEAVWKKYLFISAFASLTSYHDMTIKAVYESHRRETEVLLNEIAAVARARGVEIGSEVEKAMGTAAGLPDTASTSMHLDYQKERPTEYDALSGYIVNEGKRLGVKTPIMEKLYEGLKQKQGDGTKAG